MSSALGIDIGSSSIKVVELTGKINAPEVTAFGLAVNPVGNLETENDQEKIQIAQAIKKLITDVGVKSKKAWVALPESKVFTRVLEMPNLSDAELASAITWEAEQYLPIPMTEAQLDYQVLSRPGGSDPTGKMKVFLVGAPKGMIEKLLRLLEMVGLEAEALETEVLALQRAMLRQSGTSSGLVMLVHLGASTSDICVVENGVVVLTRSVPTGGVAVSRALASELGLELAQAEQYKRTYWLDARQLQGKVRNTLLPIMGTLFLEMKKMAQMYTGSSQGKLRQVVLSGGGAYLPEISGDITRELGAEVVIGNPFAGVKLDERQVKRLGGVGAVFAVAVGLALRGLE